MKAENVEEKKKTFRRIDHSKIKDGEILTSMGVHDLQGNFLRLTPYIEQTKEEREKENKRIEEKIKNLGKIEPDRFSKKESMNKSETKKDKKKKPKPEFTSFATLNNGTELAELVCKPNENTRFAVYKNGVIDYRDSLILDDGREVHPFPLNSEIIKNKVVLFPSEPKKYNSEKDLLKEIREFIHKYLEVRPIFEQIASYYVLFSWLYDCFNELAYLRFIGDWGTGKSRSLKVIGIISYKPIFAGGATTSSPIFRLLQLIRGTLIIDEADFSYSDMHADIIKILNCGYEKEGPVLRTEGNGRNFDVKSFNVFSPKILATRETFKDLALESRCLTEPMMGLTRQDIPYNLPDSFWDEALHIRNKLLLWRFRNYGKKILDSKLADKSIEPRLNQILVPLLSIITDSEAQKEVRNFIKQFNDRLSSTRGMGFEAELVEIIIDILAREEEPSMENIANKLNEKYGYDKDNKNHFKSKYIGSAIRKKLHLSPKRGGQNGNFIISPEEQKKIYILADKFGIEKDPENKRKKEEQKELDDLANELNKESVDQPQDQENLPSPILSD